MPILIQKWRACGELVVGDAEQNGFAACVDASTSTRQPAWKRRAGDFLLLVLHTGVQQADFSRREAAKRGKQSTAIKPGPSMPSNPHGTIRVELVDGSRQVTHNAPSRHLRAWDMTEGLVAGASAGPAGVLASVAQGASVFPPVAVGSTSASLKATRDVAGGLTHGAGVALIVAGGPGGAVAGAHVPRGVEGVLMHGAGTGANGVKAVTGTTAGIHAA
ncbi:hypothetical protein DFH29DRAFT_1084429 [Suillus ampliporus]|nr:hypothetical protein DFH29DRAFT_1084429 [Suillus ampliporus]